MSTIQQTYTVSAGSDSTELGQVGTAKTILGAVRIGRAAVRDALPRGEGRFTVRDQDGREVRAQERSIRTDGEWLDRTA